MSAEIDGGTGMGVSAKKATEICRISYCELNNWERAGLVRPSLHGPPGLGRGRYSYRDLLVLAVIRFLLEWGAPLEQVQQAFGRIRDDVDRSPREIFMTVLDGELILFANPSEALAFIESDPTRGTFVTNIDDVEEELDKDLHDVCPELLEPEPWQDACFRYEMEAQAKQLRQFLESVQPEDFDF